MHDVHESVIWHGRKLEVAGHADRCGEHWRFWIVFWGQRDLEKKTTHIEHCINSFTLLSPFDAVWSAVGLSHCMVVTLMSCHAVG